MHMGQPFISVKCLNTDVFPCRVLCSSVSRQLMRGRPSFLLSSEVHWNAYFALLESSMCCTWPNQRSRLFLTVVSSTSCPVLSLISYFILPSTARSIHIVVTWLAVSGSFLPNAIYPLKSWVCFTNACFYRAACNAEAVLWGDFCPSVCPSVCQTRELWQNSRKIGPDFYTIRKNI